MILDRVLDRDDVAFCGIEVEEGGVEGRSLPASRRTRNQNDAVWQFEEAAQLRAKSLFHSERGKIETDRRTVENAQDDAFTVQRGNRRDAQIDLVTANCELDAAVLWK